MAKRELLTPLPGRWASALIIAICLGFLWWVVLARQPMNHLAVMLAILTCALSSFHVLGWRPQYQLERYLLSPIGSLILLAITAMVAL